MWLMMPAQAQTVANFYLAFDLELSIVPVLNKIDLPAAEPEKVAEQVQQVGQHLTDFGVSLNC